MLKDSTEKKTEHRDKRPFETTKKSELRVVALAMNEKWTHFIARTTIYNPIIGQQMSIRIFFDCSSDNTYMFDTHARDLNLTIDKKQLESMCSCVR